MIVKPALLLLLTVVESRTERCNFDVRVEQTIRNEGFHRNLTYSMVFHDEDEDQTGAQGWWYSSCMVGLEQSLPAGVYVNPDELRDLRRADRVIAFPRNKVDVELSAEDADQSFVYIIGKMDVEPATLWLPVHARYHRPQEHGGTVRNIIPEPTLFLHCPDERFHTCNFPTPSELPYFCNGRSRQKCTWKEISYKMLTDVIRWDVPVGNLSHLNVVSIGTGLVVLLGSLYLLKAIHEYNRNINKKIE